MAKAGQRKCMSCGEFFIPDHRKGVHHAHLAVHVGAGGARLPPFASRRQSREAAT